MPHTTCSLADKKLIKTIGARDISEGIIEKIFSSPRSAINHSGETCSYLALFTWRWRDRCMPFSLWRQECMMDRHQPPIDKTTGGLSISLEHTEVDASIIKMRTWKEKGSRLRAIKKLFRLLPDAGLS